MDNALGIFAEAAERRMIMAQLYKMTLYVCDLEDNLSMDEIETLIKQDALDGISVNCVCHFIASIL